MAFWRTRDDAFAVAGEFAGSAALLVVVVGSGIMGEALSQGNPAIALLANALATAAGLYVLIGTLGPISGAHFNPVVSLMMWRRGALSFSRFSAYVPAQVLGAIAGVWIAHAMFDLPIVQTSEKIRSGFGQWLSEVVATGGLLVTIALGLRAVPGLVAAYIGGAYWFTASTSFANPAVTIARSMTNTFAGIRPVDTLGFIAAQCIAAAIMCLLLRAASPKGSPIVSALRTEELR
ncbi:MAG TPA: aquaporin [Rudaea sp.]|nr:aquaporin [Rudaea sp.]